MSLLNRISTFISSCAAFVAASSFLSTAIFSASWAVRYFRSERVEPQEGAHVTLEQDQHVHFLLCRLRCSIVFSPHCDLQRLLGRPILQIGTCRAAGRRPCHS